MRFPLPFSLLPASLNWGLVGMTELIFGLALLLGLFSRLSALILLIVTYVAVYSVHFDLSWSGWNQIETEDGLGFKVPLMIGIMLLVVLGQGAGRWSLDRWICYLKRG
ncbi:MAG: DoxX family protein [Burkholderiaceae bacterium]